MRENFVQSMAKQDEAQAHEESKLWKASQPLPNQSSMQRRKSEKKSNIRIFYMSMRNFRIPCEIKRRNKLISHPMRNYSQPCETNCCRTESQTEENEFHNTCEFLQALRTEEKDFASLAKQHTEERSPKVDFAHHAESDCVIHRYFYTNFVRFLSSDILCNYPIFSL